MKRLPLAIFIVAALGSSLPASATTGGEPREFPVWLNTRIGKIQSKNAATQLPLTITKWRYLGKSVYMMPSVGSPHLELHTMDGKLVCRLDTGAASDEKCADFKTLATGGKVIWTDPRPVN